MLFVRTVDTWFVDTCQTCRLYHVLFVADRREGMGPFFTCEINFLPKLYASCRVEITSPSSNQRRKIRCECMMISLNENFNFYDS